VLELSELLRHAVEQRASDLHLKAGSRPYIRIDGHLTETSFDVLGPADTERLAYAVLPPARADEFARSGEADFAYGSGEAGGAGRFRVNVFRQRNTVALVLRRVLPGTPSFDALGLPPAVRRLTEEPRGLVLVTGPTGSGKTTTLYAAVDRIRTGREKILTVEDPVEYQLAGVPQVPVNEKMGVTFATALRALLRQDPDVLLVGEIRDAETAEIATQAALTGHLVLSPLHTNDAPSALTRLLDLGIAPYLVGSTVEAGLAQRLVRTICLACREEVAPTREWPGGDGEAAPRVLWRGRGCDACSGSGYRGRTGIYELLLVDDVLRAELMQRRGSGELHRIAVARGMRTLYEDSLRQVRAGVTTVDEVLRVTRK
jgi:general secretion pathway protein E